MKLSRALKGPVVDAADASKHTSSRHLALHDVGTADSLNRKLHVFTVTDAAGARLAEVLERLDA